MSTKVFWAHSGIRFVATQEDEQEKEWKLKVYVSFRSQDEQLWFPVLERIIKAENEIELENMVFAILEKEDWDQHIKNEFPESDDKILIPSFGKSFFPEIVFKN